MANDTKWKKEVLAQQKVVDKAEKEWLKAKKILAEKHKVFAAAGTDLGNIIRGGDNPLLDQAEEN